MKFIEVKTEREDSVEIINLEQITHIRKYGNKVLIYFTNSEKPIRYDECYEDIKEELIEHII